MARGRLGAVAVAAVLAWAASGWAAEARYRLGPGDILEVSVWKDEALTREVVVPPDGVISFPLIGDIDVTGLTVAGLRDTVAERLEPYVPDPTVSVLLLRVNSLVAYVIGKVAKPGQFPIQLDTTVMQVLSMGGGLTPYAAPDKILILRQENGRTTQIPFNYDEVKKGRNLEQNVVLRRGDVVVVP